MTLVLFYYSGFSFTSKSRKLFRDCLSNTICVPCTVLTWDTERNDRLFSLKIYGKHLKKIFFIDFFFFFFFFFFLHRGRERDRELETPMREKHLSAASCTPPIGDVFATKVHALDRNQTWDFSVHRPMLYPLSQTGKDYGKYF
uniref:Uncharacterized protein n=1 Tax=Pipistrellus kuhlii TaxID=59472 RepID=A0A7J7YWP2_PIPKU|nr:hypothetical protein mPipKuh1_009860 [Pipistrellus kuhlii]